MALESARASLKGEIVNDESLHVVSELVEVRLDQQELAAVDGWRQANDFSSREDAIRHLIRLGLLSEIGRIYQEANRD